MAELTPEDKFIQEQLDIARNSNLQRFIKIKSAAEEIKKELETGEGVWTKEDVFRVFPFLKNPKLRRPEPADNVPDPGFYSMTIEEYEEHFKQYGKPIGGDEGALYDYAEKLIDLNLLLYGIDQNEPKQLFIYEELAKRLSATILEKLIIKSRQEFLNGLSEQEKIEMKNRAEKMKVVKLPNGQSSELW